ncbi:hypothetical protein KUTeg_016637 [Tegillarca granosa]|uniref:Uncharacterized protein n=1 Tax=Tegillarca granosa TaxID=220873 RepID=A0ABQ9EQ83_TEGGR|nr:hypothetical protein KUTeg_016637 [Tegillarca granosa]
MPKLRSDSLSITDKNKIQILGNKDASLPLTDGADCVGSETSSSEDESGKSCWEDIEDDGQDDI